MSHEKTGANRDHREKRVILGSIDVNAIPKRSVAHRMGFRLPRSEPPGGTSLAAERSWRDCIRDRTDRNE